jgi:hypothetical protein
MNRDIYLGLFFGGILMLLIFIITSIFKLEGLVVLFYYVILALAMSIHNLIEVWSKKK